MAAPGGGEAVWNRWDVPWPACNAAEAAPAEHAAVRCLSAVLKRCWAVDNMLNSKMLVAEQSLLHSIIYNFHYQMIHQRAYGSLKQVEQCLKRLNLMNLEKSIQEIAQIDLMILYRAVLKNLSALYKDLFELLQEVAKMHQRPYIKGFVFPSEINDFLGTSYLEIKKKMPKAFIEKKAGTGWMNKLFSVKKTTSQSQILSAVVPPAVRKKKKKRRKGTQNTSDIGKPVLINRTNKDLAKKLEFDLKTLCKYPNPVPQENSKFRNMLPESKGITSISAKALRSQHLHSFVSKFKEVQSFEELSEALKTTIIWCKSNKFGSGAFFLGMKLLKSKRLQHVEAQGCRLQRKLGCVKATICKYLTLQSCRQKPMQRLRASPQQSTRLSWKQSTRLSWKQSSISQSMSVHRGGRVSKRTASPFLDECFPLWTADSSGTKTLEESIRYDISVPAVLESHRTPIEKEATEPKDDIDAIFKVIGL